MAEAVDVPPVLAYQRDAAAQPPHLYPPYRATILRAPSRPLIFLPHTLSELTGPAFGHESVGELDSDLTRQHAGEPLGERIIVSGRVLDGDGRPVREHARGGLAGERRRPLRAPGRPPGRAARSELHRRGQLPDRSRRAATGSSPSSRAPTRGSTTPTPGVRPTSTSRCSGRRSRPGSSRRCTSRGTRCSTTTRSSSRSGTRRRGSGWCARTTSTSTEPEWALGYRFDIVLRGRDATPMEA